MAAQKSLTSLDKPNSDPYLELDKHTPLRFFKIHLMSSHPHIDVRSGQVSGHVVTFLVSLSYYMDRHNYTQLTPPHA